MSDPFEIGKSVQFKDGQIYYYPKKRQKSTVGEKAGTAAATVGGVVGGNYAGGDLGARTAGSSGKKVRATLTRQAERVKRAAASGDDIRYINALSDTQRIYRHPTVMRAGVGGTVGAVAGGVAAYKGSKKVREKMAKSTDPFEISKLNAAGIGNIIGAGRNVRRKGLVGASKMRRKWRGLSPGQQTGAIAGGAGLAGLAAGSAMSKAAALPPGPKGAEKMARAASRAARSEKVKRVVRDVGGVTRTKARQTKDAALGGPKRAFVDDMANKTVYMRDGRAASMPTVRVGYEREGNRFVRGSRRFQEFTTGGEKLGKPQRSGGGPNMSNEAKAVTAAGGGALALGAVPVAAGVAWDRAEQRKKQKVAKMGDPFQISKSNQDVDRQMVRDASARGALIGGIVGLPVAGPVGAIPGAGVGYLAGRHVGRKRVERLADKEGTDKDKLARAKAKAKVKARLEQAKEIGKSDPFEIAKGEVFRAAVYDRNLGGSGKIARKNRQVLDEKSAEKLPKAIGIGAAGGAAAGGAAGAVLGRRYGGGRMVNMLTGETVRRVAGGPRQVAGAAGYGGLSGAYLGAVGAGATASTKARLEMQRDPRYRERPKKKRKS